MAIKFLSGQTISGTLTVSGNVQGATFNGLAINTTGVNNLANQIVRTEANGYVNFGWINSVSGNHTGSITRITASNDAYLRYVTPAQFRTGVTDGYYAPVSTVSGVTSVATGNGLTGGTIISTGTLTMSGSYTGNYTNTGNFTVTGNSFLGNANGDYVHVNDKLYVGATDSGNAEFWFGEGTTGDVNYGARWYWDSGYTHQWYTVNNSTETLMMSYATNDTSKLQWFRNFDMNNSKITELATPTATTDAANKAYVDAHPGSGGTVTSVAVTAGTGISASVANSTTTPNITITNTAPNIVQTSVTGASGYLDTNRGTPSSAAQYWQASGLGTTEAPSTDWYTTLRLGHGNPTTYYGNTLAIKMTGTGTGDIYTQNLANGTFQGWKKYWNDSNLPAGSGVTSVNYTHQGNAFTVGGVPVTSLGTIAVTMAGSSSQYINGAGNLISFPTIPPDPTGVYLLLSGGTMSGDIQMLSNTLRFDQSGTRSWTMNAASGNFFINSGDGAGNVSLNCGLIVADTLTANSRIIIQPRNDNTNVGCINSTNNQSDWQNLVASSGQFTVTQYNAIGSYSNTPTGVYTYGSVLSTRTANHAFQLYSAHTGDLAYKTQWNNDNYSGWLTPVVYGRNGGNASPNANVYGSNFIDKDNTAYYVNPASGSNLFTPITFQTNDSTLTFQDAGTNAFQMKMGAGDELYLGSNNNYQLQMTTSGNVNTQGQWRFGANFVKVGNSSTYNSDDGSWGSRFVVASTVHARIDCAQDANAVRASWWTHTGQLYSSFGTVTGHDMRLMAHNTTRQWLYSAYSEETASYRAPVFYDSNNTAYYGDFAGTSTSLSTAGKWVCQGGHSSARLQLNYAHGSDVGNSGTLTGWVSEPGITYNGAGIGGNINVNGQYYGRQYNSGYGCYVRFDKSNGNLQHWTTTGNAGVSGGQGTVQWYNDASGNSYATTSSRAPIFYDSNNTGYYVDPASTSQLNVLNCAGTLTVTGAGGVVAPKFTDYNNGSFYLDPASTGTALNVAGDVVAYASSDIRFKNNVIPITNALDKINKIGGYTFEWNEKSHKETGKKDIGVIAQEVEDILPEIVDTRDNGYKAVDYSKLTALLIQSVKEQQVIIDNLKSRIETLENN